jgi:hypothetical protein
LVVLFERAVCISAFGARAVCAGRAGAGAPLPVR